MFPHLYVDFIICTLWNLVVLYGVGGVFLSGGFKWNLGDGKLAIIVFARVRYSFWVKFPFIGSLIKWLKERNMLQRK